MAIFIDIVEQKHIMTNSSKLDLKQQRFCEEYIIDWNGTQAAIRAGYSQKTARQQASKLLTKVNIQDYVQECKSRIEELAGVSKLMAIREIKKIAISDEEEATTKLRAFQDLSKMLGWNEFEKTEKEVNITIEL